MVDVQKVAGTQVVYSPKSEADQRGVQSGPDSGVAGALAALQSNSTQRCPCRVMCNGG